MKSRLSPSSRFLLLALVTACADDHQADFKRGPLCASCDPALGGETADFPSVHPCEAVSKYETISEQAAAALPFVDDLAAAKAQIEAPIDAPLRWMTEPAEYVQATGGYESETWIHVQNKVVGYKWSSPDPARCDGTTCLAEGLAPIDQASCASRLYMLTETTLVTDDGAIEAALDVEAVIWGPSTLGAASGDTIHGYGRQNLAPLRGTLQLESTELKPVRGYLSLHLEYGANHTWGSILLNLIFEAPTRTVYDTPLHGKFFVGEPPPPEEPPQAGIDSE